MFFDPFGLLISTLVSLPYRDNYTTLIRIVSRIIRCVFHLISKLEHYYVCTPVVFTFLCSLFYTTYTMNNRKLNTKQINILKTAYKFRYLTTDNLSRQRNITHNSAYSALKILYTNGYLGMKYNKKYRLMNKSARYFLTPKAVKYLRQPVLDLNEDILNSRLREKGKSSDFVDYQVAVHTAYLDIEQAMGKGVMIQTASELAETEGVIKPYPALYVRDKDTHFFVEITGNQHLFLVKKRIRKYIEHHESYDWSWDSYPNVRIIRRLKSDRKRLKAYVEEKMDDNYLDESDIVFEIVSRVVILRREPIT